jgi:hypothetical protein
MKNYLLSVLLPVALLILSGDVFSQTHPKLSGTVSDSSKPLAFVTVRLSKNNPAPLQTVLSNECGLFQFNKPDTGNYVLIFTHTGYTAKKINVVVTPAAGDLQIDPVQLSKATGMLKEVTVTSQRPMIEQSDDKIVFNVEDDPNNNRRNMYPFSAKEIRNKAGGDLLEARIWLAGEGDRRAEAGRVLLVSVWRWPHNPRGLDRSSHGLRPGASLSGADLGVRRSGG